MSLWRIRVDEDTGQVRGQPEAATLGTSWSGFLIFSRDGRTLILVSDRGNRSHLYHFVREGEKWVERSRLAADDTVFQVGPLLSPRGEKLLFAQADGDRSGEMFLSSLVAGSREDWPPKC